MAASCHVPADRSRLGGRWELSGEEAQWRIVLPTGLNFSPAGFVAAAIAQADLDDLDSEFDAPPRMRPYVQQALERMGEVSVEDYYSLCGRLDTLEHIQRGLKHLRHKRHDVILFHVLDHDELNFPFQRMTLF